MNVRRILAVVALAVILMVVSAETSPVTSALGLSVSGAARTFSFAGPGQFPEPVSMALLGAGLLACAAGLSRRRVS